MNLNITLAWRNLWRNRKRTLITMSSVFFAVVLAILFFSMEQGSYERMIENLVRYSTGYIQVQDVLYHEEPSIDYAMLYDDEIKALLERHQAQIAVYVPRLQNFALVATENSTRGSLVMGIDPDRERQLNDLTDNIVAGSYLAPNDQGLLVGEGLAAILKVNVGDTLVLLGQGFQGATAAGKFPVTGIVDLKVPELNNNVIYMALPAAQWFYGADDRVTSLVIMPENPRRTRQLAQALLAEIDREWYNVLTWEQMLEDLLTLMKFDLMGTMVMMLILYVVISFGLFGTILMMLIERRREFGLLFSLGMKRKQLALICFMESVFIALAGALLGIAGAIPIVTWFHHHPIRVGGGLAATFEDFGFEPLLPFSADPSVFYSQALLVMSLAILIGLFPVYKVFRLKIMDVKR